MDLQPERGLAGVANLPTREAHPIALPTVHVRLQTARALAVSYSQTACAT